MSKFKIGDWVRILRVTKMDEGYITVGRVYPVSHIAYKVDVYVKTDRGECFLYESQFEPCPEMNGSLMKALRDEV